MDQSQQTYEYARARFDHESARRLLKEKYEAKMLFAHAGGMWQAGPQLITLLQAITSRHDVVLLDLYNTPIMIDPHTLKDMALERWQEQMTAWYLEFENLRQQR